MKINVGIHKFTTFRKIQILIFILILSTLYVSNTHVAVISTLIFIAGVCNGNADAINFRWKQIIWRRILKGKILKWFSGEYKNHLTPLWWVHAIFYDGWHFFKNMWILNLLLAIGYSLYFAITNCMFFFNWFNFGFGVGFGVLIFMIWCSFVWMIGKEIWHHHMANASFWGLPEYIDFSLNRIVTIDGKDVGELSPIIFEHLQEMANER